MPTKVKSAQNSAALVSGKRESRKRFLKKRRQDLEEDLDIDEIRRQHARGEKYISWSKAKKDLDL